MANQTATTQGNQQITSTEKARPRPALFRALGKKDPPATVEINGEVYHLETILKHDSWAATALYHGPLGKVICKFQRQQGIGLIPMKWFGRLLASHESYLYHRLPGVSNLPQLLTDVKIDGKPAKHVVAHTYIPGHPLGKTEVVNDEFFPALENLLAEMHKRQVAYVDLHKCENIIVGEDGQPYLIDFQISYAMPQWFPGNCFVSRILLYFLQKSDHYHFRKHFARSRPDQCGYTLHDVGRSRPWWIRLHRMIGVPLRTLRRSLLVGLGIRKKGGYSNTEHFAEEAVQLESQQQHRSAA